MWIVNQQNHREPSAPGDRVESPDGRDERSARTPTSAALVDPGHGPTSRSKILEYGCLPSTYVRAVLTEHGGRIKQRRFTDEYGWSPSTVSRLLSDLEERGAIGRYRLGRETVVYLLEGSERLARDERRTRKTRRSKPAKLE